MPMMVCADMAAGAAGDWGYTGDNVTLLKLASNAPSGVGPGNFQLIELGGSGANVVRQKLAGGYRPVHRCGPAPSRPRPATTWGRRPQGLNTRFGTYQGGGMNATDYPPDKITTEPNPGLDVASDGVTVILQGRPANGARRSRTSTRSLTPMTTTRPT